MGAFRKVMFLIIFFISSNNSYCQVLDGVINLSDSLYYEGDVSGAKSILLNAIKNGNTGDFIYHRLGMIYVDFVQPDSALHYLLLTRKVTSNDSLKFAIHLDIGQARYLNRELDKAIIELNPLLDDDNYRFAALTILLGVYSDMRDFVKAVPVARELVSTNPTFYPAIVNVGYMYLDYGKPDSAIFYFGKALVYAPDDPIILNNLGNAYFKSGNSNIGLSYINKSLMIDSTNSYAYRNRGLIYLDEKENSLACDDFTKAIELGYVEVYGDDIINWKKEACK